MMTSKIWRGVMVKCADCGFLCLRNRETGELVEAIDDYRESGRLPPGGAWEAVHNYPICFAMAHDLMPEVEKAAQQQFLEGSGDWGPYVKPVIHSERQCPPAGKDFGFTAYHWGFTPKEHQEMVDRQQMIEREDRRDRETREFQARLQRRVALIVSLSTIAGAVVGAVLMAWLPKLV